MTDKFCSPLFCHLQPRTDQSFLFSLQRVKELEDGARAKSPEFSGKVDPSLVADMFLERPRMEQRFFGFRFDDLNVEGLSMNHETLSKVFTTVATVQGLELKLE